MNKAKGKKTASKSTAEKDSSDEEETYHFIGYVPAYGKVWELDSLKSGPLEVGELDYRTVQSVDGKPPSSWMDVARPALRMKMQKYGGGSSESGNIRFCLLALVEGVYEKASDEWEYWKRERRALERNLEAGWEEKVNVRFWLSIYVRL
jgi:ubiquitin carboxyl-terminal hydrolase L5